MQNKTKFPFPWFPGSVPGWGRRPGGAHLLPLPLDLAFLLPSPHRSLGAYAPFLSWRLHPGTLPAFFFLIDLGASLVIPGCARTGVPARRGSPLRHSRWVRLGRWTERGSGQDAFHSAAEAPSLSRKVEGVGARMELWNTRREAAPGLPWPGAQPQWVTILVDLREAKVSLS